MLATSSSRANADRVQATRKEPHQPLRPIILSPDPSISTLHLMMKRLSDPAEDQAPNLIIVHIPHGWDRAAMADQLRSRETEAGATKLPLISLSPTGSYQLDDRAMKDRRFRCLPFPCTVASLVESINDLLQGSGRTKAVA